MKVPEFCKALDGKLSGVDDQEKLRLAALSLMQAFKVAEDEVAFLKLDPLTSTLHFVWPEKLRTSGSIPLNTRDSFVATTVRENRPQLHNRFTSKLHASIFEQVNLEETAKKKETKEKKPPRPRVIQKIMSAPLEKEGTLTGAVQVSRKADDVELAGENFTDLELKALADIAKVIGKHI